MDNFESFTQLQIVCLELFGLLGNGLHLGGKPSGCRRFVVAGALLFQGGRLQLD